MITKTKYLLALSALTLFTGNVVFAAAPADRRIGRKLNPRNFGERFLLATKLKYNPETGLYTLCPKTDLTFAGTSTGICISTKGDEVEVLDIRTAIKRYGENNYMISDPGLLALVAIEYQTDEARNHARRRNLELVENASAASRP